ncbi:MAG: LysR substrate-binding domain-containing protein [Pseudolabrys sp.]|nr:LysR substrate-binding domain-containing protein [Pseudolabrys sp.]
MTNIPTDLLRTFVAVVDMRSFTKAAASLGVTQPAVSAQIKRLQFLLGDDIFDRSSQGVSLTAHGEIVLNYARRLLSINDQIVHLGGPGPMPELAIRVGTSSDYIASILPATLASFRERWPDVRFSVRTDYLDPLSRQLRGGEIDVLIALSMTPPHDARHVVARDIVWVRGKNTRFNPDGPVPLVSYGTPCIYHKLVVRALKAAGMDWEDVFMGPSLASLKGAVAAGLGVMAINRHRADEDGIVVWEDAPLPKLPDLYSGIYVREGGARDIYEQLADEIAAVVHAQSKPANKLIGSIENSRKKTSAA